MEVTLTFIKDTERTSAKNGHKFMSRSIKTQEHGDQFLSGFAGQENKGWKVGDTVEIETKEVEKDGKKYLNFEVPKKADRIDEKLEMILNRLVGIGLQIASLEGKLLPRKSTPEEDEEAYFAENPIL